MARAPALTVTVVEGLVVQPGETLVVAASAEMTREEGQQLRDELLAELPAGVRVLLVYGAAGLARVSGQTDVDVLSVDPGAAIMGRLTIGVTSPGPAPEGRDG